MDTLTNFWSNLFSLNGDKFLLITSYSLMFHQQVDKKKNKTRHQVQYTLDTGVLILFLKKIKRARKYV